MSARTIARSLLACLVACLWCSAGCLEYQDADTEDCDPTQGAEQYQCPDGSRVPWCTCEDGTWECVDSPEDQCAGSEPGCGVDSDCPADEYCDSCATSSCPDCEDCVPGCLPHDCETEPEPACDLARSDCEPGQVAVVRDGCWLCVDQVTCEPEDVRDDHCDDGSQLMCDEVAGCNEWEISAIQLTCWVCVDPETCRPWGEPGCTSDGDCAPDRYCDPCARGSCPGCEDCVPDCLPHGCETETEPICNMLRPDCEPGQVAVVRDGCWVCVDRLTCQPARDTSCDDGTEPICLMEPPVCDPYSEILAVQQECWECVNPMTCLPWGEPGCEDDDWCPPDQECDSCATSSCPDCDDCLAACVPHGCPTEEDLLCWCARPDCGPDAVSVIYDGCWICVDRLTCQQVAEGC